MFGYCYVVLVNFVRLRCVINNFLKFCGFLLMNVNFLFKLVVDCELVIGLFLVVVLALYCFFL